MDRHTTTRECRCHVQSVLEREERQLFGAWTLVAAGIRIVDAWNRVRIHEQRHVFRRGHGGTPPGLAGPSEQFPDLIPGVDEEEIALGHATDAIALRDSASKNFGLRVGVHRAMV